VNYFKNFGAECHLLKIGYIASLASFNKPQGCQYNLPINLLGFFFFLIFMNYCFREEARVHQ
jgi:hypothetical protein